MDTFPYLTDTRDKVLLSTSPALMQPRFGTLAPVAVGRHRFVVAADGLYVQARSEALDVTLRLSLSPFPLPFGSLRESVVLAGGPIPAGIGAQIARRARAAYPDEWAGLVLWEPETGVYRLHEPEVEAVSGGHIRYITTDYDDSRIALDVHSHGRHRAFFSSLDDASDDGFYMAAVLGPCGARDHPTVVSRIVVHGIRYPVHWVPWERSADLDSLP